MYVSAPGNLVYVFIYLVEAFLLAAQAKNKHAFWEKSTEN